MQKKMHHFRSVNLKKDLQNHGFSILQIQDFLENKIDYLKQDFIKITLMNQSFIAIRPSGTEPMLKFYYVIRSKKGLETARTNLQKLQNIFQQYFA